MIISSLTSSNACEERNQWRSFSLTTGPRVLFAIIYSVGFVLFPWEYLLGLSFPDKLNYIARFDQLQAFGVDSINPLGGVLGAFISESLWGFILYGLGLSGFSAEQALLLISFFCILAIVVFVSSKVNFTLAAIFLLNPLIVDFVMAQQRSALAFAGFLAFVSTKANVLRILIVSGCMFIHVAFGLLLVGYVLAGAVARLRVANSPLVNRAAHLLIAFIAALVLLLGKDFFLSAIGDRRAATSSGSQSIVYALFWLALIIYIVVFSRGRLDWLLNFTCLFVSLFMVAVFLNTYSSRYLVFALPFLVIALARLPFNESVLSYFLLFCYQFVQWVYWWGWFVR